MKRKKEENRCSTTRQTHTKEDCRCVCVCVASWWNCPSMIRSHQRGVKPSTGPVYIVPSVGNVSKLSAYISLQRPIKRAGGPIYRESSPTPPSGHAPAEIIFSAHNKTHRSRTLNIVCLTRLNAVGQNLAFFAMKKQKKKKKKKC